MIKRGTGKVSKKCNHCESEFLARHDRLGVYCSKSCNAKANRMPSKCIKKQCKVCAETFEVKRYRNDTAHYCSKPCLAIARLDMGIMPNGENHPNWKGGLSDRPYNSRRAIKELRKTIKACQECQSTSRLHGHHILSYADHPELVNDKSNILILCAPCRAQKHPKQANLLLKGNGHG